MCVCERLPVTLFAGHLKGIELLRWHCEGMSSKASQSRTPLRLLQQKSTMNSTPTCSSSIIVKNRMCQHSSQEQSAHWSAPNTIIPSKQPAVDNRGDGVSTLLSSTGCRNETLSERRYRHNECRKLHEDATASTSNHLKKQLHGQNSKQSIDQIPHPSPTSNDTTPLTDVAVTMTTEVMERTSIKEGSTEVTPERITLSSGSTTKRRLKLEEATLCRPQTKRRRIVDSSGSSGKKSVGKVGNTLQRENSGQRTIQSYFRLA